MIDLTFTVDGRPYHHNERRWRIETNRHPTTSGHSWGWIEHAPGNVTWSGDSSFNRAAAQRVVDAHNAWLEEQKSPAIKLAELKPLIDGTQEQLKAARERVAFLEGQLQGYMQAADAAQKGGAK